MKLHTLLPGLAWSLCLFASDDLLAQPATNAVTVSFVGFENPTNRTIAVFAARNSGGNSIWYYALEDGNPLAGLEVWEKSRWMTPDRGEICVSEMQVREQGEARAEELLVIGKQQARCRCVGGEQF